ncbi:hypothetical protein HaLaN_00687, partial [Haematococcus lacustris]
MRRSENAHAVFQCSGWVLTLLGYRLSACTAMVTGQSPVVPLPVTCAVQRQGAAPSPPPMSPTLAATPLAPLTAVIRTAADNAATAPRVEVGTSQTIAAPDSAGAASTDQNMKLLHEMWFDMKMEMKEVKEMMRAVMLKVDALSSPSGEAQLKKGAHTTVPQQAAAAAGPWRCIAVPVQPPAWLWCKLGSISLDLGLSCLLSLGALAALGWRGSAGS